MSAAGNTQDSSQVRNGSPKYEIKNLDKKMYDGTPCQEHGYGHTS